MGESPVGLRHGTNAAWQRTAGMVLSLGMLLVAQSYLLRSFAVPQAKVLFLLGLLVAWRAFGPAVPTASGEKSGAQASVHLGPLRVALVLAALSSAVAAAYAGRARSLEDPIILWLLGLGLFLLPPLAGYIRSWRPRLQARAATLSVSRRQVAEVLILCAIVCLGAYLRLFDLTTLPPFVHDDEAAYGLDALDLSQGHIPNLFDNAWQDQPRLTGLPAALLMKVWPDDPLFALRLSTALTGLLTLPLLFLLARMYVSPPVALLVVFLLAITRVDIHYSRQGINSIQVAPLTVAAMYLLLRSLRLRTTASAVVCGLVGSLALFTYFSGRVVPVVMGCTFLFMMVTSYRQWTTYLRLAIVTLVAALFVAAPLLGYYATHLSQMTAHQTNLLIWNQIKHLSGGDQSASLGTLLSHQIEKTFWGFNFHGDVTLHYGAGGPVLETFTGVLFFVGVVIALRQWRDARYAVAIFWLAMTLLFTEIIVLGSPYTPRLCGIIPLICLLAGVAVQRGLDILKRTQSRLHGAGLVAGFVLLPVLALNGNYQAYFVQYLQSHSLEPQTELGQYLRQSLGDATPYGVGTDLDLQMKIVRLLAPGITTGRMHTWSEYLPMRDIPEGDALFIAMDYWAPHMAYITEYYPGGQTYQLLRPDGNVVFTTYRVPKDQILATKGLLGRYTGDADGKTIVERLDTGINFDWARDLPQGITSGFSAQWDGSLLTSKYATHTLTLEGTGEARLVVDGREVITKSGSQASASYTWVPARGWHVVHLEQQSDGGSLQLLWQPSDGDRQPIPQEMLSTVTAQHGLFATYYEGASLGGRKMLEIVEPAVFSTYNIYVDTFGGSPWSARWTGSLTAPVSGSYTLGARGFAGTLTMIVDGKKLLEFGPLTGERGQAKIDLSAGQHSIELTFVCPDGRFDRVELWWAPPGQAMTPVPPSALTPVRP